MGARPEAADPRETARPFVQGAVAIALAATVSLVAWDLVGNHLAVRTDIVGSTIFGDSDVYRVIDHFYIVVLLLPGLAAALFLLMARWGPLAARTPRPVWPPPLSGPTGASPSPTAANQDPAISPRRIGVAARVALPALVIAAEVEIGRSAQAGTLSLSVGVAALAAYVAAVTAAATVICRRRGPGPAAWSSANAFLAVAAVPMLLLVSASTTMSVASDGRVVHYPWLPIWLALIVTVLALALIAVRLRRGGWRGARRAEELVLTIIVGPVALFLVTATLQVGQGHLSLVNGIVQGSQWNFDGYDDAMSMTGAQLLFAHGLLPWRDVFLLHGFLFDALYGQVGMWTFGNTVWGSDAGYTLLVSPVTVISLYGFIVYFGRRRHTLIFTACLALALGLLVTWPGTRFLLLPPVLILFDRVLQRGSWSRCWAFMAVAVLTSIVTPESTLLVVGVLATLVLADLVHHRWGDPLRLGFRRTLRCAVAGVGLTSAWVAYLLATGSLSGFVNFYRSVVAGHELWGFLPIHLLTNTGMTLAFAVPVALFLMTVARVVWKLHRRAPWRTVDWVLVASGAFVPLYYQEAIDRLDYQHVDILFQALTPFVLLWFYDLVSAAEGGFARLMKALRGWGRRPRSAPGQGHPPSAAAVPRWVAVPPVALAVVCVAFFSPQSLRAWADLPANFHATAPAPAPAALPLGYTDPGAVDLTQLEDLAVVIDRYAGPTAPVFDFTNEPGVTFFLLNRVPAAPYYHVGAAETLDAQQLEVDALESSRPPVAIFNDTTFGIPDYDDIWSMERDYLISQYLLDHYRPILDVQGQLVMLRDDLVSTAPPPPRLAVPPVTTDLYFAGVPSCDWRYIPDFLDPPTAGEVASGQPVTLTQGNASGGDGNMVLDMAVPAQPSLASYQWLELDSPGGYGSDTIEVTDRTLGSQPSHVISFQTLPSVGDSVYVRVGSCIQWHGYAAGELHLVIPASLSGISARLLP